MLTGVGWGRQEVGFEHPSTPPRSVPLAVGSSGQSSALGITPLLHPRAHAGTSMLICVWFAFHGHACLNASNWDCEHKVESVRKVSVSETTACRSTWTWTHAQSCQLSRAHAHDRPDIDPGHRHVPRSSPEGGRLWVPPSSQGAEVLSELGRPQPWLAFNR